MVAPFNDIGPASAQRRRVLSRWWGGVGCRVFFVMFLTLLLVTAIVVGFFYHDRRAALDDDTRARLLSIGEHFAAFAAEDVVRGSRDAVQQKLDAVFASHEGLPGGSDLEFLAVFDEGGRRLGLCTRNGGEAGAAPSDIALPEGVAGHANPVFSRSASGVDELLFPLTVRGSVVGVLRLGVADRRHTTAFHAAVRKAIYAVVAVLLIGLGMSRVIAESITRPIKLLNAAVQDLERQNWKTPLTVSGRDEISKLGQAFNQMALTIRQRDASLSRANRDLFLLHAAGLDLMEGLEVETLLPKIARRATDLVQADTVLVATIDRTERSIRYLGAFGSKAAALTAQEMPLESGGIYNWIVSYGIPLLVPDAQTDFRLDRDLMARLGVRCLMTAPLWSSNAMTGLLTVLNKHGGGAFDKHDFRLFTVFSNLIGAALQNAQLYGDLKKSVEKLELTQGQLIHSTKMAAIGELSANVAHEINNPLTSVLGYASHLLRTAELPDHQKKLLRMMEQETLRVRKIIRNLLDFARQRPSWMQPSDLLQPLRETVALVQGVASHDGVIIREEYDGTPIIVNMDTNEVKQVFINIVTNALQAMPDGGTLIVRSATTPGNEAMVSFADTGVGIPDENRAKIFEPFFSTKGEGRGTGLGLSISYRIMQNHGGRIEVDGPVGGGSTFRVFFPLARPGGENGSGSSGQGSTQYAKTS
jgi:signal transduction histidine kinase